MTGGGLGISALLHEWGIAEVAAHLGRTRGATREFLSQARKRLAPFVEPCRGLLPEAGA